MPPKGNVSGTPRQEKGITAPSTVLDEPLFPNPGRRAHRRHLGWRKTFWGFLWRPVLYYTVRYSAGHQGPTGFGWASGEQVPGSPAAARAAPVASERASEVPPIHLAGPVGVLVRNLLWHSASSPTLRRFSAHRRICSDRLMDKRWASERSQQVCHRTAARGAGLRRPVPCPYPPCSFPLLAHYHSFILLRGCLSCRFQLAPGGPALRLSSSSSSVS